MEEHICLLHKSNLVTLNQIVSTNMWNLILLKEQFQSPNQRTHIIAILPFMNKLTNQGG